MGFTRRAGGEYETELQHVSGIKGLTAFVFRVFIGRQLASFVRRSADVDPQPVRGIVIPYNGFVVRNNNVNDARALARWLTRRRFPT